MAEMESFISSDIDTVTDSTSSEVPPGKPSCIDITASDITLSWRESKWDQHHIESYEIRYRKVGEKRWIGRLDTNEACHEFKVCGLESDTAYEFKVRAINEEGDEGQFSEISGNIQTKGITQMLPSASNTYLKSSMKPGKPFVICSSSTDITLAWSPAMGTDDLKVVEYEVKYRILNDVKWSGVSTKNSSPTVVVDGLESNTLYQLKIRAVTEDGDEGPFSEVSETTTAALPVDSGQKATNRAPGKPVLLARTFNSLTLSWEKPAVQHNNDTYEIKYKTIDGIKWNGTAFTKDGWPSIEIGSLESSTNYAFKVRTIAGDGTEGPYSNESGVFQTEEKMVDQRPGIPIGADSSSSEILLYWEAPEDGTKAIANYEIKYKKNDDNQWKGYSTSGTEQQLTITELKCDQGFQFKVRAVYLDGEEGPFSDLSEHVYTKPSLTQWLIPHATKVEEGCPQIYKLPLTFDESSCNSAANTRKGYLGKQDNTALEKTIMVVGATGAGKSTLIDGMINYIMGVAWEDNSRLTVIDMTSVEKSKLHKQDESQTEWITCYTINRMRGSQINFNLNIIDTPGFGDTRGITRDKQIVDQIREFFTTPGDQGISSLDAVCFVTQAPLARLTPPQKYIFDAILSIFGHDIKNNIFVLITFADGNEPPVKAALKAAKVPFERAFIFNNSALFVDTNKPEASQFGQMFWKMGKESFRVFFDELNKTETRSLQLTSEVLQTRKKLEATIQGIQPQIQEGLHQLSTIEEEQRVLHRHKTDIEANKNFQYEVTEIHQRKVDLASRTYVTNCLTCNRTCHYPCGIPSDSDKSGCAAMDGGGSSNAKCTVCPGKCRWTVHKNNTYRFETYPVKVKKTYDDLKDKYHLAHNMVQKQTTVLGTVRKAFRDLGSKVGQMVQDVRKYINNLNQIALKPNPLSEVQYIDLLIESEKSERKYGYQQRINMLMGLRREADLIQRIPNQAFKPWGDLADLD